MSLDVRDAAALFDPARLKLARQLHGITRAELARRAGLSAPAISQLESGTTRPRPATLAQLALTLKVPAACLASPGEPTLLPGVEESFFRSLRRTTQRDREKAAAHAGLAAELTRRIERSVALPAFSPEPDLAMDASDTVAVAERAAEELRRRWNIPDGPIDHVVRLMEQHGIIVVRLPLLTKDVDAFSWAGGQRPIVVLGSDKGVYERSRLDAAHELAHVMLHAADPEPASPPLEAQAQRFAAALLVPAEALRDEWPRGRIDWRKVQQLRQKWGLSMSAILYRARELELVAPTAYTNAMKYLSRRGWRVREPGPARQPEEPGLLTEAIGLLAENGLALEQLAADAHLIAGQDLADRLRVIAVPRLRVSL